MSKKPKTRVEYSGGFRQLSNISSHALTQKDFNI